MSLLVGDCVAFWFLWDIPMTTRLQPETWRAEWITTLVLLLMGFGFTEMFISLSTYLWARR